jgi:DNA-binding MarR family transcriptional regulator
VTGKPRTRRAATDELLMAGRIMSNAAVMFHAVLAEKQGLAATEEKAIDLLERFGPLTAGELSEKSGLAPASITGLIDRLEKKGFVKRIADAADGRRVRVELRRERLAAFAPLFFDFVTELEDLCTKYSVEELDLIAGFMTEAARRQQVCAGKLSSAQPPKTESRPTKKRR